MPVFKPTGVKSWNDLKDRPFYDESYTGEITIEYDGDPTGKQTVAFGEGTLVKISDWTSEPTEFIGGTAVMGEETVVITEDMIYDCRADGFPIATVADVMLVVYGAFSRDGIVVTEAGTYVIDQGVAMSLKYTGTATRIHTLDKKYLPGDFTGGGDGSSNVHVLDIGDSELDVTALDLSAYSNGDVLVIVQNTAQ